MGVKTIDKNGELYVGEVNLFGQPNGHGTLTYKYTGGKYEGEFRKGKPHGFGKYTASDGYSFEGSWDNGIEVEGRLICANGDIYEGRMRSKGERVYGVMTYADGEIYEGEWLGTDRDGKATVTLPDGSRYERLYKNDKVVSSKQISAPKSTAAKDGSAGEGSRENGVRNGFGVLRYPGGDKYEGEFRDGVRCGWGKYTHSDGHYSMCTYKNDKQNGPGMITNSRGDVLYIDFKDGHMDGWGVCILNNGVRQSQYYKQDKRIKVQDYDPDLYEPASIPELSAVRDGALPRDTQPAPVGKTSVTRDVTVEADNGDVYVGSETDGVWDGLFYRVEKATGKVFEQQYENGCLVSSTEADKNTADVVKYVMLDGYENPFEKKESSGEPQEDIRDIIDKYDRKVLTAIRRVYELGGEEAFAPGGKAPALLSDLLPGDSYSKERRRIKKAVNCGAVKLLFRVKNEGSVPELHCAEANRLLIDQEDMSEEAADLLVAQLLAGLFADF